MQSEGLTQTISFADLIQSFPNSQYPSVESMSVRPQNDPDSPPKISLVESTQIDQQFDQIFPFEPMKQEPWNHRIRSNSENLQFTILGFLCQKLRQRGWSEQYRYSRV